MHPRHERHRRRLLSGRDSRCARGMYEKRSFRLGRVGCARYCMPLPRVFGLASAWRAQENYFEKAGSVDCLIVV